MSYNVLVLKQMLTTVIQEYNVRANTINKQHFIGRFLQGQPMFSKKKSGGPRWSLQREGLTGRQLSEAQRVWILLYMILLYLSTIVVALHLKVYI